MPLKNRTLPLLLLFIWIFQGLFSILYFESKKNDCWNDFVKTSDNGAVKKALTISFAKNADIDWEKENREFKLNGRMYDVISITETTSKIIIECMADKHEDTLIAAFLNIERTKKNKDDKEKTKNKTSDYLNQKTIVTSHIPSAIKPNKYIMFCSTIINRAIDVDSPPPKELLF